MIAVCISFADFAPSRCLGRYQAPRDCGGHCPGYVGDDLAHSASLIDAEQRERCTAWVRAVGDIPTRQP